MNIDEQLENILADLGVEMENPKHEQFDENSIPEVSIFQASRDHYGVFYRLDIIEQTPQLRIMMPIENGALKMEMYLVTMSEQAPLNNWFSSLATYHGSPAFERGREAAQQHLLYAVAEMMKQLFWAGDLSGMCFPAEIVVYHLV
jgi:hypothetical protein